MNDPVACRLRARSARAVRARRPALHDDVPSLLEVLVK
jgi:hypothetical protein